MATGHRNLNCAKISNKIKKRTSTPITHPLPFTSDFGIERYSQQSTSFIQAKRQLEVAHRRRRTTRWKTKSSRGSSMRKQSFTVAISSPQRSPDFTLPNADPNHKAPGASLWKEPFKELTDNTPNFRP